MEWRRACSGDLSSVRERGISGSAAGPGGLRRLSCSPQCQESVDVDLARAETAQILSRRWPVRTEVASVILVKGQFGEFKQRKILRDELGRAGGQDCESSRYG